MPLPAIHIALDATDVERQIYLDADSARVVRRVVIGHAERVRSGSTFKFVYPSKPPYVFRGDVYRLGTYVYDDATEAAAAIIFYMENADADYPSGTLPGADEDGDLVLTGTDDAALLQRMRAAISVDR